MTDDVQDALGDLRRGLRRVEDDTIATLRKKAPLEDVELLARKQSEMETETRGRLQSILSEMHAVNENIRRLTEAVEALAEDHKRLKRTTAEELDEVRPRSKKDKGDNGRGFSGPMFPPYVMYALFLLAGIGLLALMNSSPGSLHGAASAMGLVP